MNCGTAGLEAPVPLEALDSGHATKHGNGGSLWRLSEQPPHKRRASLVSILDMLRFYTGHWVEQIRQLQELLDRMDRGETVATNSVAPRIRELQLQCQASGFDSLEDQMQRFLDKARKGELPPDALKYATRDMLDNVLQAISRPLYFVVGLGDSELFSPDPELRRDSAWSLQEAVSELEEARKCLALDRNTACVLHCMRGLDLALQVAVVKLGIDPPANWQRAIDQITAIIAEKNKQDASWRKSVGDKWAEVATEFPNFKAAWRDPAMHGRTTYPNAEARSILDSTKRLLLSLSPLVD